MFDWLMVAITAVTILAYVMVMFRMVFILDREIRSRLNGRSV